jgi:stage II sporulation protein M
VDKGGKSMPAINQLRRIIREYFGDRLFLLALVAILFFMGIVFGLLAVGVLAADQKEILVNFIQQSFHTKINFQNHAYTRQTIVANIQTVFFLFFMGISVIGVPLALLLIFTRGFILGFSLGFLFQNMGFRGFILAITGVLPHNLLMIPALFLMVVAVIDCAAALTKIRFTRKPVSLGPELVKCAIITSIVLVFMICAGLVQGYISPFISLWLARVIAP